MTNTHIATVNTLPSSVLHNSTELRRQYVRAATKQAAQVINRKMSSWCRKAGTVSPDMAQMQGGH